MKKNRTEYVTLHFPLLLIDETERNQWDKVIEEYNEFKKELFNESEPDRMLHELQDIVQSYLTLLCIKAKPFSIDDRETFERVLALVEHANQEHRKKLERYRVERGWN